MNEIKLQSPEGKHPVDENLRPILVGGKSTAIETAQHGNGVRVNGDLEVTGDIKGNIKDMVLEDVTLDSLTTNSIVSTDLTIDDSGSISLDATSGSTTTGILLKNGGTLIGDITVHHSKTNFILYENGGASDDDFMSIQVAANGATTIGTTDAAGDSADLTLDVDGDITLDSQAGSFMAYNAGTQFSADKSAYAGMMLGCTHVFGSGTAGTFVTISTAWDNLLWDTDKYALVTFVVPPSNRVKISVHLPYVAAASYQVRLGLATDDAATTLNTKYENDIDDANRADSFNINYSWVVEGSDHSWAAGETKTIYIMAYTTNNVRFYTGGTNTSTYGGVIVEATALPATIGNGEEP